MAGQHQEAEKSTLAQTTIQTCLELGHQTIHWPMDVYGLSQLSPPVRKIFFMSSYVIHSPNMDNDQIRIIRLSMVIHVIPRLIIALVGSSPTDPHDEEHQDAMEALVSEARDLLNIPNLY